MKRHHANVIDLVSDDDDDAKQAARRAHPTQYLTPLPELDGHAFQFLGVPGAPLRHLEATGNDQQDRLTLHYQRQARVIMELVSRVSSTQQGQMLELLRRLYSDPSAVDVRPDFAEFLLYYIVHDNVPAVRALTQDTDVFAQHKEARQAFVQEVIFFEMACLVGRHASLEMVSVLLLAHDAAHPREHETRGAVRQFFAHVIREAWTAHRMDLAAGVLELWQQWMDFRPLRMWPVTMRERGDVAPDVLREMQQQALLAVDRSRNRDVYRALRKQGRLPHSLLGIRRTHSEGKGMVGLFALECYVMDPEHTMDYSVDAEWRALRELWLALPTQSDKAAFLERHLDLLTHVFRSYYEGKPQYRSLFAPHLFLHLTLNKRSLPWVLKLYQRVFPGAGPQPPQSDADTAKWIAWAMVGGCLHLLLSSSSSPLGFPPGPITPEVAERANQYVQQEHYTGPDSLDVSTLVAEYTCIRQHPTLSLLSHLVSRLNRSPTMTEWQALLKMHPEMEDPVFLVRFLKAVTAETDRGLIATWLEKLKARAHANGQRVGPWVTIVWTLLAAKVAPEVIHTFLTGMAGIVDAIVVEVYENPGELVRELTQYYPTSILPTLMAQVWPTLGQARQWLQQAKAQVDLYAGPIERGVVLYLVRMVDSLEQQQQQQEEEKMDTSDSIPLVPVKVFCTKMSLS